jgi:hypothetical protein
MKLLNAILSITIAFVTVNANAQISLAAENYIVLNGGKFTNQKFSFTKAEGDWFAISNDAHATILFSATVDKRLLQFAIEWDGTGVTHAITDEVRHNGLRTGDFLLSLPDKEVYGDGINASPVGEQQVTIEVVKINDTEVAGKISGSITSNNDAVEVTGVFNLKRAATKAKSTSKYKDYDNVIHDKLTGAENRSPSQSEAMFDLDSRKAITEALAPLITSLQAKDWSITEQTKLDPLTGVQRESETRLFNVIYHLNLQLSPGAPLAATYKQQVNELNDQMQKNYASGKDNAPLRAKYAILSREMNGALNIQVSFFGNAESAGLNTYRHPVRISRLANGSWCIYGESASSLTGGGEDNAVTATVVLLGNWKQLTSEKFDDGGEGARFKAVLNPAASKLQMQNLVIRIESNNELAQEIIKQMDFSRLISLIGK